MMITCPKCRKQSPADAAFCGFCGSNMQEEEAPAGAKTVFGYNLGDDRIKSAVDEAEEPPPPPEESVAEEPPPVEAEPEPAPDPAPDAANTLPLNATTGPIDGKYHLGEVVERLQVGDIYDAKNEETGSQDALLLVDASVFPSPLDLERARRELKQMMKLDSDHIIKVKEFGKVGTDRLFIVTEQAPVTSLAELASAGPFSLAEAQYVIKSVGAGLSEAQKRGVIHRDIAPHNIVLDSEGVVKVRGFGVAPVIKRQVIGTPEYISPEQAKGRPVDQRSNIYNLGALLYFLLAGEPPFQGASPDELLQKHQNEEPMPLAERRPNLDLPDKAGALILKALAKSSSRRHLTLRQFLREAESLMPLNEGTVQESLKARVGLVVSTKGLFDSGLLSAGTPPAEEATAQPEVDVGAATVMDMAPVPSAEDDSVTTQMESVPAPDETAVENPDRSMDASKTLLDHKPQGLDVPPPAPVEEPPPPPVEEPPPAPVEEPPPAPVEEPPPPPVEEPPPPVMEPPPPVMEPPPPMVEPPVEEPVELSKSVQESPQAAGEVTANDVSLKAPDPVVPKDRSSFQAPEAAKPKPGFRETLWFVKGKAESESVESGEGEEEPPPPAEPDTLELAEKYDDDGSIGAEGAHELSLRTGKTQQMKKIDMPTNALPGETMDDGEFISEMNRSRTIAIWVVVFIILAGIAGVVVYLLRGGDEAAPPSAKPAIEEKHEEGEPPPVEEPKPEGKEEPKHEGKEEPKHEGKEGAKAEPRPEPEKK